MRPLTPYMKTTLLDLYAVVMDYDDGKPMQPHDVRNTHHKILKGLADDSRRLIVLEACNSPTGIVWTVRITPKGLREAKKLEKENRVINDRKISDRKKKPRKLKTIQWQVNVCDESGLQVYEDVKTIKGDKKQSFTRTVNSLITMHKDLKAGEFELFRQLYPEAYTNIIMSEFLQEWKQHTNAPQAAPKPLARDLHAGNGSTQENGLKQLKVPQFAPPQEDDEDTEGLLVVTEAKVDGLQISMNFVNSIMGLQE